MASSDIERLSIDTIRTLSMDAVQAANSGHPGLPMAMAPAAYLLYTRIMEHNPTDPNWPDRDRFILSAGHGSMLLYSVLHLSGYALSMDEIKRFRQWGSITPGHPERDRVHVTEGVEVTTGPLGQGFANGVGMAMAERVLADRFNRPHHEIVDHRVYAICSDDNHITIDGTTAISFSVEDKGKRFEAQGWHVQHVDDANDLDAFRDAIRAAQEEVERPSMIVVRSHIGFGAPKAV